MVNEWYGTEMPVQVMSREDHIRQFEEQCAGLLASWSWDLMSKNTHLVLLWMNERSCVDLIVKHEGVLRFVQDLRFKEEYATPCLWHMAIKSLLDQSEEVWVVFHV